MSARHTKPTSMRRRLLVTAGFAAVLVAFVATAFGMSSRATSAAVNNFHAGSVTLSSAAAGTCTAANLFPGAAPASCTLQVAYTGNAPGFMSVDVLVATKAGNGGTALYNPGDLTHGLQITVTDNQPTPVTYVTPATSFGAAVSCPGAYSTGGYTCYRRSNLLVRTAAFTASSGAVTFATSVSLPANATTGYRGGAAAVVVTAHGAQSAHNGTTGGCVAGSPCASIVSWS